MLDQQGPVTDMDANMQEALRKEIVKRQRQLMRQKLRKMQRISELWSEVEQLDDQIRDIPGEMLELWQTTIAEQSLADTDTLLDA